MSARGKDGKGGKKGKKGQSKENVMTNVDRTFYELTINDLNQKLAHLQAHLRDLGENNVILKDKMRAMTEERGDEAGHLQTELEQKNAKLTELEERMKVTIRLRDERRRNAASKIEQLEAKYKAMHDQIISQIKQLNGQLNSLNDFRENRDAMLMKFDNLDQAVREKEHEFEVQLAALKQAAKLEKDQLKRDVEIKLLQFAKEYLDTTESRNAAYTRRLVRENIAIKKEIDLLLVDEVKLNQDLKEHAEKHEQMRKEYASMVGTKKALIRVVAQKGDCINRLSLKFEQLQRRYDKLKDYKALYERELEAGRDEEFQYREMSRRLCDLGRKVDNYKLELIRMEPVHQRHTAEINGLRKVIERIKVATQKAINTYDYHVKHSGSSSSSEEAPRSARNLVTELVHILSQGKDTLGATSSALSVVGSEVSVYHPGDAGIFPAKSSSLMDLFKRFGPEVDVPPTGLRLIHSDSDSQIIPSARSEDACTLMDVEYGSTLYVASDREDNPEMPLVDEEFSEGGEEGGSSSSDEIPESSGDGGPADSAPAAGLTQRASAPARMTERQSSAPTQSEAKDEDDFDVGFFY